MMKRFFLFDLDGTLTDTGQGIMKSAQFALDRFGFPHEPEQALRRFVGPPLEESFRVFYGLSPEQARQAVELYRVRYREKGVFESPLYPGVEALLRELSARAVLCLATSKPLVFARQILEMRGVAGYFTETVGAELDGTRTDKAEVIREVLRRLGNPPPAQAVMIGDRRQDVLGAKAAGAACIGAGYGYAEPGELEQAGADWTVADPDELLALCLSLGSGGKKED